MSVTTGINFVDILRSTQDLKGSLLQSLERAKDDRLDSLTNEVSCIQVAGSTRDAPPLSIAFVGQYNAGKSTLMRVLTGRSDISVSSDVTTDKVSAYDWGQVRILDTPGVHAGYRDHDEKTNAAIEASDLLVFVVTNELFDDTIGAFFRELAFNRNKAREMLLVVNKMSQGGTPEMMRPDIEKVTRPLACDDFRTVFVDARCALDADGSQDPQERAELLEIANIAGLVSALNQYVNDRGLMGRLKAPLAALRSKAMHAKALVSATCPEETALLQLLNKKRNLFSNSMADLRVKIEALLRRSKEDISLCGDKLAERIGSGVSREDLDAANAEAGSEVEEIKERLASDLQSSLESEVQGLRGGLEKLGQSDEAKNLEERIEAAGRESGSSRGGSGDGPKLRAKTGGKDEPAFDASKMKRYAETVGSFSKDWSINVSRGAKFGTLAASSGSRAHQAILGIGKLVGHKFKPWGAVKGARLLGRVGQASPYISVVFDILKDKENRRQAEHLADERDRVRRSSRDLADEIESAYFERLDSICRGFYDVEMKAIDDAEVDLVGKRDVRDSSARAYHDCAVALASLMDRVEGMHGRHLPGAMEDGVPPTEGD